MPAIITTVKQHFGLPDYAPWQKFNKPLFAAYIFLHLAALAAPFTYDKLGLFVLLGTYFLTICLGITLGYHRLLAHRSYQTHKPLRYILAFLGCLAFQRGPIWWTACHRLHHSKVDKVGDPHSPSRSFVWAHILWPFFQHPQLDATPDSMTPLVRDLLADPGMRLLEKHYALINVLFLALLFAVGCCLKNFQTGLSLLVWGGFLRIALCLHITWLVNSVGHIWGYRNYETPDQSRNNWWVALLTYGEGWHNNHHADARAARNGHRWYEIDITYYLIRLLNIAGLAYNIMPVRLNVKS